MENIKIPTAQFENSSNDIDYNLSRIKTLTKKLARRGSVIVASPESSIIGYTFARIHYETNRLTPQDLPQKEALLGY